MQYTKYLDQIQHLSTFFPTFHTQWFFRNPDKLIIVSKLGFTPKVDTIYKI